jgi:hypothetical protein
MAQISCLTSSDCRSALETAAASSPGYDGGVHFPHHERHHGKNSARIKLLVDNMFGDKILLIIRTYCISKAIKNKKITK